MTRSVPLPRLPSNIVFPAELAGKVSYDPVARRLSYNGFMCKGAFDQLTGLSNDVEYLRAVEELFQKCIFTEEEEAPRGPIRMLKAVISRMFM